MADLPANSLLKLQGPELTDFIKHYKPKKHDFEAKLIFSFDAQPFKFFCNAYIKKWYNIKDKSEKEKNPVMRAVAKMFLNSAWGKTATRTDWTFNYFDEENLN